MQEVHHPGDEVGERAVVLQSERIEEVFLPEFRLRVERNRVEVCEELIHVVRIREVEVALLEGTNEVAGITLCNRFEGDDEERSVFAAPVESQLLSVGQDAVLRPEVVHVVEQLRFVRREASTGRLEFVDCGDGLVRVKSDVIWSPVVRECELASEVSTRSFVVESIIESLFQKEVFYVSLAHIVVRLLTDI
ncbi:hypothetical protein [Halogeometricum borinquense]|uniref:hypothetical protein n=1 Tax=Halogeometricum borinquense TaxID=60847 RepID=UPI001F4D1CF1|nr:hypothetical protein [Halogeometricum borinquense]